MDVLTTSSLRNLNAIAVSVCFERCQTRFSTLQSAESIYRLVSNGAKVAGEQAVRFLSTYQVSQLSMCEAVQAHVEKVVTLATASQPVFQIPVVKLSRVL